MISFHAALVRTAQRAVEGVKAAGRRRGPRWSGWLMRELDVVGVRVEMPSNAPMVLLREVGGSRYLPIWIGANEASAIANAQEGVVPPRP